MSDVAERVTQYLVAGGFFNPELMEHDKVRDLLIDCRDEIARLREERRSISTLLQKVEGLEAENKRLSEERRWVPVGERLPPDNVAVLCWVDGCGAEMVWREKGQWFLSFAGYPISDSTYTHWQPLPPGPEANG